MAKNLLKVWIADNTVTTVQILGDRQTTMTGYPSLRAYVAKYAPVCKFCYIRM